MSIDALEASVSQLEYGYHNMSIMWEGENVPLGLAAIVVGYLLGSIPSAYIMARLRKGVDIREFDVGNMGAANVLRHVGVWEGIIVALADMAKGAAAIVIAQALSVSQLWLLGAGFSALLGHNFPVFVGFRGGKGSATTVGIFLLLAPKEIAIVLGIMAVPFFITRNFAFTVCVGFVFIPLLIWLFGGSVILISYSLAILIFLGVRSLPNARQAWPKVVRNKNITTSHRDRHE